MLALLIRFFSMIFLVWLVRRLVTMFIKNSRTNQAEGRSAENSNHMVKDPVCGMYLDSRLAVRLEQKQEQFYFCSEDCKKKYLDQPSSASKNPSPG
jgi:uncharacterized protein